MSIISLLSLEAGHGQKTSLSSLVGARISNINSQFEGGAFTGFKRLLQTEKKHSSFSHWGTSGQITILT